jgi:hypothetical protein
MTRALLASAALLAVATPAVAEPDLTGSWERYPPPGEAADPRYAPVPVPNPPLKQPWLAEWQANEQKLAGRLQEGPPAGDKNVHCLPHGLPPK